MKIKSEGKRKACKEQQKQKPQAQEKRQKKRIFYCWLNIFYFAAVLFLLAYPRIYPYTKYLSMDTPFADPDTCYHARRIIYVATHNMQLPFYDPLIAHPYGAIPMWSPLYDWISALPSFLISFGHPGQSLIIWTSMLLTLIYGLSALALLGLLVYRVSGNLGTSLLAAFVVGMTIPHIKRTSIDIIDDNSLLLLLFSVILLHSYRIFSSDKLLNPIKDACISSLLLALLFWVWPGAYIYIATIALFYGVYALVSHKMQVLKHLALSFALAALLVAPLAFIHYRLGKELLRFEYVSLFTVIYLLMLSLVLYFLANVMSWKCSLTKGVLVVKLGLSLLCITILLFYSFKPLIEGIKFAYAQNAWLSTIEESRPLLLMARGPVREFTLRPIIGNFGYLVFLFPVALILMMAKRIKVPAELSIMLVVSSMAFGVLALFQRRYAVEFAVPYGIILSLFIAWLYRKLCKKHLVAWAVLFAAIISVSLLPLKAAFKEEYSIFNAFHDGFEWLRKDAGLKNTEINTGHVQPYGAMAAWDFGHHLHLYSEMPTVADNFGINVDPCFGLYDMARFFLSEDEGEAVRLMKKYKCTYVVVPSAWMFEQYSVLIGLDPTLLFKYSIVKNGAEKSLAVFPQREFLKTVALRLADAYGSANPANDPNPIELRALKHFRLVYESPAATVAGQPVPAGSLKIYKYVDGSILNVNASGNPFYELEALIKTNLGRYFYYRQQGYLNEKIIAPYSTCRVKDYPYAEYYKLRINGRFYEFKNIE